MRILFAIVGARSAEQSTLWLHEQKESLEEAILRMGSEQIWIKKGKDKLCLKDKSVW